MAISQSHTLGELIGVFFENTMSEPIKEFAKKHNLYFDKFGSRAARRSKKVRWTDINGNAHDLDFVLEEGGTEYTIGKPVAFIELAWRRYTKHSKNKVQEIAGAINPIVDKYAKYSPFKGAILSGEFTSSSLEQLRSQNFEVLYISFSDLVDTFKNNGIDIYFDENSTEADIRKKISAWKKTNKKVFKQVQSDLLNKISSEIETFLNAINVSISRKIHYIQIIPLHGKSVQRKNVESAIKFIHDYKIVNTTSLPLQNIEVIVKYTDNTLIECKFKSKKQAIDFLKTIV